MENFKILKLTRNKTKFGFFFLIFQAMSLCQASSVLTHFTSLHKFFFVIIRMNHCIGFLILNDTLYLVIQKGIKAGDCLYELYGELMDERNTMRLSQIRRKNQGKPVLTTIIKVRKNQFQRRIQKHYRNLRQGFLRKYLTFSSSISESSTLEFDTAVSSFCCIDDKK